MRYASACSGVEAATVAWHKLGFTPVWFSQFDPEHNYEKGRDFPSEAIHHHYPQVPNLGDMMNIRTTKTYIDEQFDIFVAGTPCQSFSIAGLRKGMGDERGNLALEFVRILIDKRPRWFVWENVPGVLTSGKEGPDEEDGEQSEDFDGDPRDFACLLSAWTGRDIAPQEFEKSGIIEAETEQDYSIAWRILDSQYFGVPQRRRRIFVVGHLGKDWRPPVAVLFEQDSLRRDFTPGGKKRKGAAGNTQDSAGGCGEQVENGLPAYRMTAFGAYTDDGTASALKKRDYKDATDLVLMKGEMTPRLTVGTIDCRNDVFNEEISGTLQSKSNGGQSLNFINPVFVYGADLSGRDVEVAHAFKERGGKEGGGKGYLGSDEVAFTLSRAQDHNLFYRTLIRRLTPLECCRLQGFPDDYLSVVPGYTDSKAYAALGNSMTTHVMHWIGKRIDMVDKCLKELQQIKAA